MKSACLCLAIFAITPIIQALSIETFSNLKFGASFQCKASKSDFRPWSVHRLRPGDVEIIAAMGDSITAGSGVYAGTLIGVLKQYRGHTFTMGGAEDLSKLVTLPNILRKFNSKLVGYSTGIGGPDSSTANMNVAVVGDIAADMPDQARKLVIRLKARLGFDFNLKWKVINIFIGGNDICRCCLNKEKYSPSNYQKHLRTALDYLKENVPRAFVNLISVVDASAAADIAKEKYCKALYVLCPCASLRPQNKIREYVKQLQQKTEELVETGRYDTKDDFTVVVQPFMKNSDIPRTSEGKVDLAFFAPDCFHFSEKLHAVSGAYLWKNMIEPVGRKTEKVQYGTPLSVTCPSESKPYLFTRKNS